MTLVHLNVSVACTVRPCSSPLGGGDCPMGHTHLRAGEIDYVEPNEWGRAPGMYLVLKSYRFKFT